MKQIDLTDFSIAISHEERRVYLELPISFRRVVEIGMTAKQARDIAILLQSHAAQIDGKE